MWLPGSVSGRDWRPEPGGRAGAARRGEACPRPRAPHLPVGLRALHPAGARCSLRCWVLGAGSDVSGRAGGVAKATVPSRAAPSIYRPDGSRGGQQLIPTFGPTLQHPRRARPRPAGVEGERSYDPRKTKQIKTGRLKKKKKKKATMSGNLSNCVILSLPEAPRHARMGLVLPRNLKEPESSGA